MRKKTKNSGENAWNKYILTRLAVAFFRACKQGRTGPPVHRTRTGAPLPKIGISRPYYP